MKSRASGPFDVQLTPQAPQGEEAANPGRMLINKHFHGDLEASSKGQMLSAMSPIKGSAGYVAIEEVTGTLHRRRGSFMLQHTGFMNRGTPQLSIVVVPDSGTGELTGLSGSMSIQIAEGKHSYEFEYTLGD
jgi:Protein of unknown function (DUF3224)